VFYEKWARELDANLSPILTDYDLKRHRALRIVLRAMGRYSDTVEEVTLLDVRNSGSVDFKKTLLKKMAGKIAIYNPGAYDVVKISWDGDRSNPLRGPMAGS
jgi:hypothetical protein